MRFRTANITPVLLVLWALSAPAWAVEISIVALYPGRAMLIVDKGKPRTLRAGETYAGITLISSTSEEAIVSINGKHQRSFRPVSRRYRRHNGFDERGRRTPRRRQLCRRSTRLLANRQWRCSDIQSEARHEFPGSPGDAPGRRQHDPCQALLKV